MASFLQFLIRSTIVHGASSSTSDCPKNPLSSASCLVNASGVPRRGRVVAVDPDGARDEGRRGERERVEKLDWRRRPRRCSSEMLEVLKS
jgi:hypothetical protein